MKVNPLKVNIELKSAESNGKWYAKKEVSKDKETTVTFFQRDGKRTLLQKFQDFKNNVRSGTDRINKYRNELGIPEKTISNLKNKSVNNSITNEEINTLFRAAHAKLQNDEAFQKSDPLVSRNSKPIEISINSEPILKGKDFKTATLKFFSSQMNYTNKDYESFKDHIALALDIRANPKFQADGKKIDQAIDALKELKNINLLGYEHKELRNYDEREYAFNEKVDSLIAVLNTALKKTIHDSTAN